MSAGFLDFGFFAVLYGPRSKKGVEGGVLKSTFEKSILALFGIVLGPPSEGGFGLMTSL
jgi:hypothetical protein